VGSLAGLQTLQRQGRDGILPLPFKQVKIRQMNSNELLINGILMLY